MSDLEEASAQVVAWLEPLGGDGGPGGADLEYDNDFLALTQAAAGKPESQFGPAEPPDWRQVADIATQLFDRTRDLRVAVEWLRAAMHLLGYGALPLALKLVGGLVQQHWDHVYPLPDDGDPWPRANALALLGANAGALNDVRQARLTDDRSIGVFRAGDVEAALAPAGSVPFVTEIGREQAGQMLAAALARTPALRATCEQALAEVKALMAALNDRLGSEAPDLKPLHALAKTVLGLLPAEAGAGDAEAPASDGETAEPGAPRSARGLAGSVTSRDEAMRAIDMVIDFLERTEPTNPAPLFLRRARKLVGHNFLQLMKALAPDALPDVARVMGVDPESVQEPEWPESGS